MQMRVVRVTIAPGKTEDYWAWAKDIVKLWDSGNIRRAGGPYALKGANGEDVALWLTVHEDEESMRNEFRELYGQGWGAELIAKRPPLVAETTSVALADWDVSGPAPAAPTW